MTCIKRLRSVGLTGLAVGIAALALLSTSVHADSPTNGLAAEFYPAAHTTSPRFNVSPVSQTASALDSTFGIGSKLTEFPLEAENGLETVKFTGPPATLVIFVSKQCPVSNAYNSRMNALRKDYAAKNVQVIFANPNITETKEDASWLTDTTKLGYKVYRDLDNKLADKLGASFTPEAYVFDSNGVLKYHGAIDNSQNEAKVEKKSLRNALDAVIGGKDVDVSTTKAFGCSIKRKK